MTWLYLMAPRSRLGVVRSRDWDEDVTDEIFDPKNVYKGVRTCAACVEIVICYLAGSIRRQGHGWGSFGHLIGMRMIPIVFSTLKSIMEVPEDVHYVWKYICDFYKKRCVTKVMVQGHYLRLQDNRIKLKLIPLKRTWNKLFNDILCLILSCIVIKINVIYALGSEKTPPGCFKLQNMLVGWGLKLYTK